MRVLLALSFVVCALATLQIPTKLVFESSLGLENIAVRPSSQLLLTSTASPTLFTLDPASHNASLTPVFTFPDANALTGIAEYRHDVYAVIVLNLTTLSAVPGTVAVWSVDLTGRKPAVHKIASIGESVLANGLSTVLGHPDLLLASDSKLGVAFEINVRSGAVRVALSGEAFALDPTAPSTSIPIGVNGLHVHNGDVFFANTQRGTFSRSRIAVRNGKVEQAGAVQVLSAADELSEGHAFDDFAFDTEGRAWVATNPDLLTVFTPSRHGKAGFTEEDVQGNPVDVTAPSSAAFGRGLKDKKTIYVTTRNGQLIAGDTAGVRT